MTTTLIPTALGSGVGLSVAPTTALRTPSVSAYLVLPPSFPLQLSETQVSALESRVAQFDFEALPARQVATLGQAPTDKLNRLLDGVLARVNKAEQPQLFKLVDTLSQEVAKERIGDLAESILAAKPSLMTRLLGLFSKKALQRGMDRAYEELGRSARSKSKSLSDVVTGLEQTLKTEMTKLNDELVAMEKLKNEYRASFVEFAQEVVFLNNAMIQARAQLPALLAAAGQDVVRQQELQDKLQSLESVALSREAMMTRMPAEQLIIRQLQNAGIATLQELTITMGDRFASIRMTLLGIHGANLVRGVQRLGQANAQLDAQLQEARAKLMGTVVTTAANAPGDNRLAQANQLRRVVDDTKALQDAVDASRQANQAKFEEARTTMAAVRQDLLALGLKLNPADPLTVAA